MAQIQEKFEALQARKKALHVDLADRVRKVESMASTFRNTRISRILNAYTGLDMGRICRTAPTRENPRT